MSESPRLLTVVEAAAMLGIGRSLLYQLVLRGDMRSIKVGRARRIPVVAIDEFIAQSLARDADDYPRGVESAS